MSLAFSAPSSPPLRPHVSAAALASASRPLLSRSAAKLADRVGATGCSSLALVSALAVSFRCSGRSCTSRTARGARRREVGLVGAGSLFVPGVVSAESQPASPAKTLFGGDLSYPDWLLGEWKVASELTTVEVPQGDALAGDAAFRAKGKAGTREGVTEYVKRFVSQGGKIINDRSSPSRPLLLSLGSDGPAESIQWSAEDPDVAVLKIKRGSFAVTVNLRSVLKAGGVPEGRSDLFNASELFFASTEAPAEVTPVREVTKFKRVDELPGRKGVGGVQELLRIEVYPAVEAEATGQFSGRAGTGDFRAGDFGTPIAIYKFRALLAPKGS